MNLLDPVETLKGIGEKTAAILNKAGIKTVRDFLYNLPRDYESYSTLSKIKDIQPGKVIVKGKINSINTRRTNRRNFTITEAIIQDDTDVVRAVWFNQPYRAKQFDAKKEYYFSGLYDFKNGRYQITSPTAVLATDIDQNSSFVPIYVAHGNLKSTDFKRLIANCRPSFADIPDLLPEGSNKPDFVHKNARADALLGVHFPENAEKAKKSRDYLAYEELFELLLAAKLNKQENKKLSATPVPFDAQKVKNLVEKLPFKLTNAQRLAAWEIFQDLGKNTPTNRLLQGDVGSGKTIVAALAAYAVTTSGAQTAILAPTAILATQHYEELSALLAPFGIKTALLTGAIRQKPALKQRIKDGEINLIIGTHALLTDDTEFNNLALAIIDEQHRFGVEQREKLLLKSPAGKAPHFLAMTATPIPRSLQLTIFGDLDISILNELPKGRQPIKTTILPEVLSQSDLYPKIRELTHQGQQVYWICKAIEDDPSKETSSVKKTAQKLQDIFGNIKVEFLHGRMKQAEKDAIMEQFSANKIQILVSTTVVEVGVNVPNANLIVIEDAENYGLAQLHQLRGRVGRGQQSAFCYLLTKGDTEPSRRLKELEKSTDGFYLAEVDLKLRGPGEIYGKLQHGALDLRIATLSDTKLIALARKHVDSFIQNPDDMVKYKELSEIISRYQQLTTLN